MYVLMSAHHMYTFSLLWMSLLINVYCDQLAVYPFGLGKRSLESSEERNFSSDEVERSESLEKRAIEDEVLKRNHMFGFGLGKRDSGRAQPYSFGVGKREPLEHPVYSFGVGKRTTEAREDKDRYYSSVHRKRKASNGQRFSFGVGKRIFRAEEEDVDDEEEEVPEKRNDNMYGFGIGKRDPLDITRFDLATIRRLISRADTLDSSKRTSAFSFGIGKRSQFGFGLGKRKRRTTDEDSEENLRV